jgi:hypothetical protein
VDFYVLDHEGTDRMSDAQAKRFVALVKAARAKCGLYASLSGFPSFGQSYNWIALWASTPPASRSWAFWQFGGSPLDHDVFNGTRAELRAFVGYGEVPMSDIEVIDAPALVDLPAGVAILNPDGSARMVNAVARAAVLSPFRSRSSGGTLLHAIRWARPAPDDDLLLAVYASAVVNVRPVPSPAPTADVTPYSDADLNQAVQNTQAVADSVIAKLESQVSDLSSRVAVADAVRVLAVSAAQAFDKLPRS